MAPPEGGYGPVNYSNPQLSPFAGFDNMIRYNDMVRHQMVSQYHQNVIHPATMALSQQRNVASNPNFQYGVQGGQDPRFYQRQSRLNRMAYGSALMKSITDLALWETASTASLATGFGGFVLPLAATIVPMEMLAKGVRNNMERQRYMHGIAADVEQYRSKLGFRSPLSYDRATQLGEDIYSEMASPGQFFSREQQMRIHKIGLSNDLLTAKSRGINSGTTEQYKRNVKELTETTEEVVKLLQTTLEGGMSVIKELQNKGFGTMKQIKQQVLQAKAIGGITGLGSQNTMLLGASGAQAAQNTPWSASTGANLFQYGAAQANAIAQSSRAGAYAVQRMGGVASSGAALGVATMNMLSSGIGTRLSAYAMNPDGTVNEDKLDKLLSGGVSAYDIVTRSNQVGYGMGGSRVRFGMFKEDLLNELGKDPAKLGSMMRAGFSAWEKQRPYDKLEDKAWVYAGQFTNDSRQQRLVYHGLLTNPNNARINAAKLAQTIAINPATIKRQEGLISGTMKNVGKSITGFFDDAGEWIGDTSTDFLEWSSELWDKRRESTLLTENALKSLGLMGKYQGKNRAVYGDLKKGVDTIFGLNATSTEAGSIALSKLTAADIQEFTRKPKRHAGVEAAIRGASIEDLRYITNRVIQGGDPSKDPGFLQAVKGDESVVKFAKDQPDLFRATVFDTKNRQGESARVAFKKSVADYDDLYMSMDAADKAASKRRMQLGIAAINAGKFESLEYVGKSGWLSEADKKDRYLKEEWETLSSKAAVTKFEQGGLMLPDGTIAAVAIKDAVKATESVIKEAVTPRISAGYTKPAYARFGSYVPLAGAAEPYEIFTEAEGAERSRRFAKKMGIKTNKKGWERQLVLRAQGMFERSQEGLLGDIDKEMMGDPEFREFVMDDLKAARKAISKETGLKEYGVRHRIMRSFAMNLPDRLKNKEFARILSTKAILDETSGGMSDEEFKKWATGSEINIERFREGFGFLDTEARNLTKATFLQKALNNENAYKTAPGALARQIQITKDMETIYSAMKNKVDTIKIGREQEEIDIGKKGAAELLLKEKRDERENLRAEHGYINRDETSQARGIASTVRPEILNYWNNSWMV